MTQSSRPQAENVNSNPLYIDSGPYSRDEWAQRIRAAHTGDVNTASSRTRTRGPVPTFDNMLCPIENSPDVLVSTGAGIVYGSYLFNSATVTFTPAAAVGAAHWDLVCMVENNTNAAVATDSSGNTWQFPNDLTDYGGLNSVPPYSARLVTISGADGGARPTLDQLTTLYCVKIAEYQIDNGGAISNFLDTREFSDIETIVGVYIDEQTEIEDAVILGTAVNNDSGDDGLGVAIRYKLENDNGDLEDAGRAAIRWTDSTNGSEDSREELYLSAGNALNLSRVTNAPTAASADGNARGTGAVDQQQTRSAATQVASGADSTISGGRYNVASSARSTVSGGETNTANGTGSTVGGGSTNIITTGTYSVIAGGGGDDGGASSGNSINNCDYSSIIGGIRNRISNASDYATICGGMDNTINDGQPYSTICGGRVNTAGVSGFVGGGYTNTADTGIYPVVTGGQDNTATGDYATIVGGYNNTVSGDYSFIGAGDTNTVSSDYASIMGGDTNTASGDYSSIPGGYRGTTSLYGQVASASGYFASAGDAQGTIQLVARGTTAGGGVAIELFLDGAGGTQRMVIPASSAWTFDVLLVAMAQNAAAVSSFQAYGVIYRDNAGNTSVVGVATTAINAAGCNMTITADDPNDSLLVQFSDDSANVFRAVATIRLAQVTYP